MSALESNSVGGIPNNEQDSGRGAESTPQQIHQEGAQYVKEATQANQQSLNSGSTTGTNISRSAPEPIREQPPASNPGADDPTGGIPAGAGGVSGSAYVESPVQNEEQGIVNTVKQFLGLSVTEEKRAEDTQPAWNNGNVTALSGIGSTTAAPAVAIAAASGAAAHHESNKGVTAELPDRTKPSMLSSTEPASAAGYSISTGPDYDASSRSVPLASTTKSDNSTTSAPLPSTLTNPAYSEPDPAVTAGSHSTKTGPDSSSTANKMEDSEPHQHQSHHGDSSEGSEEHHKKGSRENPDAIPTAGGEKLGEKHWGESEIVPELPPKRKSQDGGVSSSAGQPTSQVADNTAANTGGATSGPHGDSTSSETQKESTIDKIKDKLNIGKK